MVPPIRTENFAAGQRAPELGRHLRVEWFSKFYQRHKCNYTLVLDSDSDCVSGENNQNIVRFTLHDSFWKFYSSDELLVQ